MKKLFILAAFAATFTACTSTTSPTPTATAPVDSVSVSVEIDSAHVEETFVDTAVTVTTK
jgi:hypothetical protein